MLCVLDLIRVDAYIIYKIMVEEEERLEQKGFVLEIVDKFLGRSKFLGYYSTRSVHEKASESNKKDPIYIYLSNRPLFPPIIITIRWWSSNTGA